jgi:hypothetical protein
VVDVTRRRFLAGGSALGLLALVPPARLARITLPAAGYAGRFLTAHELDTLRAVTGRLLPGPPDDPDPGAVEAGAAEAIDLLLGAFTFDPPLIHAGGPWSDRAGGSHDLMATFVALDPLAELGWRIRIEGSQGRQDREFAGPVQGAQELYREGLAHLDAVAQSRFGMPFAGLPGAAQDSILHDESDATTQTLIGVALPDTLAAVYGPPEYGGNRGLAGWRPIGWRGDVQPRGYTAREVSELDRSGSPGPAPAPARSRAEADALLSRLLAAAGGRPCPSARWWERRPPFGRA